MKYAFEFLSGLRPIVLSFILNTTSPPVMFDPFLAFTVDTSCILL